MPQFIKMKTNELTNSVVRAVMTALRDGNRVAFFAAFAASAELTDDGQPEKLAKWADREPFEAHGNLKVQREQRDGLDLVGRFHSDQWDMMTIWRFKVANGRVQRLDVAAL